MGSLFIWIIAFGAIAGILFRPKGWPEAVWACLGAGIMVLGGLLPVANAVHAVLKGTDVYLFLAGMMLFSELARREGVFDWLAGHAVTAARGSPGRLFALVYTVGIFVTVFLSNDATAVVLTPAVYASVRKARATALPYLLACAFIANAASFVLPISNPANLVVFGKDIPPLFVWLKIFLLPSVVAIAVTYAVLHLKSKPALSAAIEEKVEIAPLSPEGRRAAIGLMAGGLVMVVVSALGLDLGPPTCLAGILVVLAATRLHMKRVAVVVRDVSWSVLPMVAGLFAIVEALNDAGALKLMDEAIAACLHMSRLGGALVTSFGIATLSNLVNNLPSGLLAGSAAAAAHPPDYIRQALMVGVDLGPNLSVTGSLATVLWLIALRREGEHVSGVEFLKIGALVMPPALLLAIAALALQPF